MKYEGYYKIGYVAKTHGLRGEVTIHITEPPKNLNIDSVFIEKNTTLVPHFITSLSGQGDKVFIKFEQIDTLEDARLLKGCSVFLSLTMREKVKSGNFYDDEIIGFEVIDLSIGKLGKISFVSTAKSNKLLVVLVEEKELLIPTNGPFILGIDKDKKTITVSLPDGYIDIL